MLHFVYAGSDAIEEDNNKESKLSCSTPCNDSLLAHPHLDLLIHLLTLGCVIYSLVSMYTD